VSLGQGNITNTGTIQGGAGGSGGSEGDGGNGGAGVYLSGGTLVTSGTISGGEAGSGGFRNGVAGDAVQFGHATGTLVVDPGAVFNGLVVANGAAHDVLDLVAGGQGVLSGLGAEFSNFATVSEAAGANWILGGANIVAMGTTLLDAGFLNVTGSLTNDSVINVAGSLTDSLGIAGAGTLQVGLAGSLALLGGAGSGQLVDFLGSSGFVELENPLTFLGAIAGFGAQDVIDLQAAGGLAETGYSFAAGTLTIVDGSTTVASLRFEGSYTTGSFSVSSDGHSGLAVTFV
jgi:hypothetical protein